MLEELKILENLLPLLQSGKDAIAIPPGDDCAGIDLGGGRMLLLAVDQLIDSVHYVAATTSPEMAARKLLNRNLSDIAAMGGVPHWALLAVAAADDKSEWVLNFCRGVGAAAEKAGVKLVGGDIAAQKVGFTSSLTIAGLIEGYSAVTRNGARASDSIYVTGVLGNSFGSGHHLSFTPRLAEGKFLAERKLAGAMIDISDGLYLDLERILIASEVGAQLDLAKLPLREGAGVGKALGDGEDYELLFTVPQEKEPELLRNWSKCFAPITQIGKITRQKGEITDLNGQIVSPERTGYEH